MLAVVDISTSVGGTGSRRRACCPSVILPAYDFSTSSGDGAIPLVRTSAGPRRPAPSGQRTPAARARAGRAAQAVLARTHGPAGEPAQIEAEDVRGLARLQAQLEHLVEVAVVEPPVVADADQGAAHEAGQGGWVERGLQARHVRLVIA